MKTLAALLLAGAISAHAEVKLTVGEISDRRTTGQFFNGLEIELKVAGPELADCKGMRIVVQDAADDTGKALERKKGGFNDGKFEPPQRPFAGFGEKKADEFSLKLEFENPTRAAKSLKEVNGAVELLIPKLDPAAVITVPLAQNAGKPVVNDALKAAGVDLTLSAIKGQDVGYVVKDPGSKIAAVEFCAADSKALETQGSMSSSAFGGPRNVTISLKDKPPGDAVARIYLLTDKSVVKVPIALRSVPLP